MPDPIENPDGTFEDDPDAPSDDAEKRDFETEYLMRQAEENTPAKRRERRTEHAKALAHAEWNMETLLELQRKLSDHSEWVRIAAFESLMEFVNRGAAPITITPLSLLEMHMFNFTVASGMVPATFRYLLTLKTLESRRLLKDLLDSPHMRNEDFQILIDAVVDSKDPELLAFLKALEIPAKQKAKIVRAALRNP